MQQGLVGCGSGGGPGNFAGGGKFGVGTASYGGLREYLGGWNRGECFAKGAAAASGSGGGPGYLAGVSSGGRTCGGVLNCGVPHKLLEKEDGPEVCMGSYAESSVGLERKLIPQDIIKGNIVNDLNVGKGSLVSHVPFSFSQRPFLLMNEARTIVGPHNFKTTYFSIHEANFLAGLIISEPISQVTDGNSVSSLAQLNCLNYSTPLKHISLYSSHQTHYDPLKKHEKVTKFDFSNFKPKHLTQFSDSYVLIIESTQPTLYPTPRFFNATTLFKPNSPAISLTNEELKRQWKPGINLQKAAVKCCRGRTFSASYYPP